MKSRGIIFLLSVFALVLMPFLFTSLQRTEMRQSAKEAIEKREKKERESERFVDVSVVVELQPEKPVKKRIAQKIEQPKISPQKKVAKASETKQSAENRSGGTKVGEGGINLVARYNMPVEGYIEMMQRKGGKVVVYEMSRGEVVCELIGANGTIISHTNTLNFSKRARRMTGDYPDAAGVLSRVEDRFGPSSYEIVLLLPTALDNRIYRSVSALIGGKGVDVTTVSSAVLLYSNHGGRLTVTVESASGSFGMVDIRKNFQI